MQDYRIHVGGPLTCGLRVVLQGDGYAHLIRVLRRRVGDPVTLFDGDGGEYAGVVETVNRRDATVRLDRHHAREVESSLCLTLVQGISRGKRMDYTLQKATELGVTNIVPVVCSRSMPASASRVAHWRSVVVSACEQCGRNRIPLLHPPLALADWLSARDDHRQLCVLLDPRGARGFGELSCPGTRITLLVGPEGGFEQAEYRCVVAAGFQPVRLGPRVLRTETAGVAALAALQLLWGDLGR